MSFADARAAYAAGNGDSAAVLASMRITEVWLPLDAAGRIFTLTYGGLPWLLVFTTADRLHSFAVAAGRDLTGMRMIRALGAQVVDQLMNQAPTPTALIVDAGSHEPFTFAPVPEVTPHCYVDVDEERLVRIP